MAYTGRHGRSPANGLRRFLQAACCGLLGVLWASGGTLEYAYDAETDTPGDNIWVDEQANGTARRLQFNTTAIADDITALTATALAEAYLFGGGLTKANVTDNGGTGKSYDGSAIDSDTSSPACFEFWFKPTQTDVSLLTANQILLESGGSTHGMSMLLMGSSLEFRTRESNANLDAVYALANPDLTDFIQAVGVVDTTAGNTRLYVNGILKATTAGTKNWGAGSDNAAVSGYAGSAVGGVSGTTGFTGFSGHLALIRLFKGPLSDAAVYATYGQIAGRDAFASLVLAADPVVYYRYSEPVGVVGAGNQSMMLFADEEGSEAGGGTITHGVAGLTGSSDTAFHFDGASYVTIPGHALINTAASYPNRTVELWFNADVVPTGTTAADVDILADIGGATNGEGIQLDNGHVVVGTWVGSDRDWVTSPQTILTGQDYHVVLAYDSSAGLRGYVNGALIGQSLAVSLLSTHSGGIAFGALNNDSYTTHGTLGGDDKNHFTGTLDEPAIYNTTFGLADVQAHYSAVHSLGVTEGAALGLLLNFDATMAASGVDNATWRDTIGTYHTSGTDNYFDFTLSGGAVLKGPAGRGDGSGDASGYPGIEYAYSLTGSAKGAAEDFEGVPGNPTDNPMSTEIWFSPDSLSGKQCLFETGGSGDGFSISLNGSSVEANSKNQSYATTASWDISQLSSLQLAEYIQVVVTWEDGGIVKLYVNGQLRDTQQDPGLNQHDWSGSDNSGLGAVNGSMNVSGYGNFSGRIAILRLYEGALAADDVLGNWEAVVGDQPVASGQGSIYKIR